MRKAMVLLIAILAIGSLGVGLGPMAGTAQDLDAETRRGGPDRAASYINPDTGMETENPNVKRNSECETPDQKDRQRVSPEGSNENNVHNDACLFTAEAPGTLTRVLPTLRPAPVPWSGLHHRLPRP